MRRATGHWRLTCGGAVALAAALLTSPVSSLQSQGVRFERTGFRMTSIGERIALTGRVLDARRRPVATGRIRWRVADPTIASVNPQGVVVSRKTGNTRLWAISGRDSTSALIVVDQWAAKFEFAPALVRLDAVGAKTPLRINVRDAEGHLINDQSRRAAICRSLNERVAALATNGEVTARGNGATYVRCTDRGIADSVRIEVRQRPARVSIADKTGISSKIVGDSLRLRLTAHDRSGDEIRDPQATWASLNPTIVSVDPTTGAARMIGGGTARIVAQVGDVSDTATVAVAPGFGQAIPVNADSATALDLTPRVATLDIDPVQPREGDQATLNIKAREPSGADARNPAISLRSSDTSIFVVLSGGRIQAKKSGTAYVVGRWGAIIDSAMVNVRSLTAANAMDTVAARRRREEFRRPTFPDDSLRNVYRLVADSARNQMFRGSVVARGASGRMIAFTAIGGTSAYTFFDSSGTGGLEQRSGVVYGGAVEVAPIRLVKLGGEFKLGQLKSDTTIGSDLESTEASADLTIQPVSWIGIRGSYVLRALNDGIALQRWTFPRGSLLIKMPFVGGQVTTLAGVSLLAGAAYSGSTTEKPDPLSLGGEAGIDIHTGWFSAGILYSVEHFKFKESGRRDQFSTLRLRLGLQRGR